MARERSMVRVCVLVFAVAMAGCALPGDGGPGPATPPTRPAGGTEDTQPGLVALREVVVGLAQPLGLVDPADGSGRLFIVEQQGTVRILRGGALDDEPFLDVSGIIQAGGEQGLLSLAFDPADPSRVVVSYTDSAGDSVLALYRVDAGNADRLDLTSARVLLKVEQPFGNHNGGLALFGPDGMLYWGLGDGGSAGDPLNYGQNVERLLGSILRLDVSGDDGYAIPPDNPFVGREGRGEIAHYGLRNPWRFSFDRETAEMYIGDVGQSRIEEINHVPSGVLGLNFGWSVWEGSQRHKQSGIHGEATFPVAEYTQADTGGCSVTGGYVYRGAQVPSLAGKYVYADYCAGTIWTLERVEGEWATRVILETDMRISAFGEDAAGEVYVIDHGGSVHRFVES